MNAPPAGLFPSMSDGRLRKQPLLLEPAARDDAELAVAVAQVVLDGGERQVQRVGDLAVLVAGGGELGDAALAGRERAEAAHEPPARPGPGRAELAQRVLLERRGAAAMREVERATQRLPGLDLVAGVPEGDALLGERARELEPGGGAFQDGDGLTQQLEVVVGDPGRRTQRDTDRARCAAAA